MPETWARKTHINKELKIQNMTGVHLRFVMGGYRPRLSSAIFIRI
jgi:hypothetical protein